MWVHTSSLLRHFSIHFTSSHPPDLKKAFVKGEALRLLTANSFKKIFVEKIKTVGSHFMERGYPKNISDSDNPLWSTFEERKLALQPKQRRKRMNRLLSHNINHQCQTFKKWHLLEQQTTAERYPQGLAPHFFQKRGLSLKDVSVKAELNPIGFRIVLKQLRPI